MEKKKLKKLFLLKLYNFSFDCKGKQTTGRNGDNDKMTFDQKPFSQAFEKIGLHQLQMAPLVPDYSLVRSPLISTIFLNGHNKTFHHLGLVLPFDAVFTFDKTYLTLAHGSLA